MQLPAELQHDAQSAFERIQQAYSDLSHWTPERQQQLKYVMAMSCFVEESLLKDEGLFAELPDMLSQQSRADDPMPFWHKITRTTM